MIKINSRRASMTLMQLLLLLVFAVPVSADEIEDRRIKISLSVFPRVVAVDEGLENKLTADNKVKFLLIYNSDRNKAQFLADTLMKNVSNLHGKQLNVEVEDVRNISLIFPDKAAALFVTERLNDDQFDKIVRAGVSEQITIFSPFAGDVERGATVGLAIGNRVMPYFNIKTLKDSGVKINSKLLSLSKKYE